MKKILLLLFAALLTIGKLSAQNQPRRQQGPPPPPVPVREVSGIVKDTTDATVPGAVVKLVSKTDSVTVAANMDGIFVFKNIKAASFVLTVSSIGYRTQVKNMKNNDAVAHLVLDPIILKSDVHNLKEVTVNGTPSIVYKVDTIEYKASDYHVRENATLDELLKKMEGFEVGSDGSVTHQGQAITKVKLNGKDYAGGDVAQAIQNLPADIIEKAQVVDDYGDAAAHSGIKDGDPQKILNVTTRADRSVGTTGRLTGQAGNNDRYNAQLFTQRINANQQLGVIANYRKTVTGVAQSSGGGGAGGGGGNGGGGGGGNPGTTETFSPSLNYRDQYGKKLQVVSSVTYGFTKNNSISQSYGTNYTNQGNSDFKNNSTQKNNSYRRGVNLEFDYDADSLNYFQLQPTYSYSTTESYNTSQRDNINHYVDDFGNPAPEHKYVAGTTVNKSPTTSYGALLLYNHRFRKPGRNLSFQLNYTHNDTQANGTNQSNTINYADSTSNTIILNQPANLVTTRDNRTNNLRASLTYSEPLSALSRIELNAQTTHNSHHTNNVTDSLALDSVTNHNYVKNSVYRIFDYATTETRMSLNYRYSGTKVNLSLGATAMPYQLNGSEFDNSTGDFAHSNISFFRILPIFRFSYSWSRTERLNIYYTGNTNEPQFQQIQPFVDKTDPNNWITGNSHLRAGLNNSVNISYNNYFPNSRFNISLNANGTLYTDQTTSNTLILKDTIKDANNHPILDKNGNPQLRTINNTTYVNLSGSKSLGGNYNISKQLDDRRYNLALNGRISYSYNVAMSDNVLYHQTVWDFNERFGPRIDPTDNIEVNPFIGYESTRTFSTAKNSPVALRSSKNLGINGFFYFLKTWQVHYDAQKQLISQSIGGAEQVNPNKAPLVIDGGFLKEFGARRQFTLTFDVFDILHQNNFVNQTSTAQGVTNTISSSNSRYFLIGFRLNLQKWSGRPQRGGRDMQRRGDGSFIYN